MEKDHIEYFNRGLCYKNLGQDSNAIQDFKSCISLKKDFINAYKMIAKIYAKNEDIDDAIDWYSNAIDVSPSSDLYFDRGVLHDSKKDFKLAVKDFTTAYKRDPEMIDALYNRASIYQRQLKQFENAVDDYSVILDSNPDDVDSLLDRAICYYQLEDDNSAKLDFKKLFRIDPTHDRGKKMFKKSGYDEYGWMKMDDEGLNYVYKGREKKQ